MPPVERHASTPPLPPSFRIFSHPGYLNVYSELRDEPKLYCTETIRGLRDWNAPTLLMAQDAVHVIKELIVKRDPNPWRHAVRDDPMGWRTNERVEEIAAYIDGSKLYGSILAHMLKEDDNLPGLYSGPLHEHLKLVLEFVVRSMANLKALVCLGNIAHRLVASWVDNGRTAAALSVGDCEEVGLFGRRVLLCRLYRPSPLATNQRGGLEARRMEWQTVARQINRRIP